MTDLTKYFGEPVKGAAYAVATRRAAAAARGPRALAAHDALAARNSEALWAAVAEADEAGEAGEVES